MIMADQIVEKRLKEIGMSLEISALREIWDGNTEHATSADENVCNLIPKEYHMAFATYLRNCFLSDEQPLGFAEHHSDVEKTIGNIMHNKNWMQLAIEAVPEDYLEQWQQALLIIADCKEM